MCPGPAVAVVPTRRINSAPECSSGRSYYTWLLSRPGRGDAEAGDRASIEAWEETLHLVSPQKIFVVL